MTSIISTLEERGSNYGDFKDNASVTQALTKQLRAHSFAFANVMSDEDEESTHMVCHKIARIVCGDGTVVDNWHDIAGYARLAMNESTKPAVVPGGTPTPADLFNRLKQSLVSPYSSNQRALALWEVEAINTILVSLAYIATEKIFAYHCWEAIEKTALKAQSQLEDLLDE